jgi:hypothetical protein
MPKRVAIQVGSQAFYSKKEAKEFCRVIVSQYPDYQRLAPVDDDFLRDLIQLHPQVEEKVGAGISHFSIALDGEWKKTRHFVVHRLDGTSTDFSYHTCIDGTNDRQDRYAALRYAVSKQVTDFKRRCFAGGEPPICVYSGSRLTEVDAHVDHESPFTFLALANAWLIDMGLTVDGLQLVANADNQWVRELRDQGLIKSWQTYHAATAKLRLISKSANLSAARAKGF